MKRYLIAAAMLCIVIPTYAHHSFNYMVVESYDTPKKGDLWDITTFNYFQEHAGDKNSVHTNIGPILNFGITDELMLTAHTHEVHFKPSDDNNLLQSDNFTEAFDIGLQYRFTKCDCGGDVCRCNLFDFAAFVNYEHPTPLAKTALGDMDNVTEGLIFTWNPHPDGAYNITLNIGDNQNIRGGAQIVFGLGAKAPLIPSLAQKVQFGAELVNGVAQDTGNQGLHLIAPAIYAKLFGPSSFIKIGPGWGLEPNSTHFSFNVSFGFKF